MKSYSRGVRLVMVSALAVYLGGALKAANAQPENGGNAQASELATCQREKDKAVGDKDKAVAELKEALSYGVQLNEARAELEECKNRAPVLPPSGSALPSDEYKALREAVEKLDAELDRLHVK